MIVLLSDAEFWGRGLVVALAIWAVLALVLAPLLGRRLARQSRPTLADQLRAARSEPADAAALSRKLGLR